MTVLGRGRRGAATVAACTLILALAIAGCGSSSETTGGGASTGGSTAPGEASGGQGEGGAGASAAPQLVRRSPAAKGREPSRSQSAAGACGHGRGDVPTVTIAPDVPVPQCMVVRPGQRLRVLNETAGDGVPGEPIHVALAGFRATVPLGGSVILDAPFRTYLKPGWHYLNVTGGPGPAALHLEG